MRVVVFGSTGMLGRAVVEACQESPGVEVQGVSRYNCDIGLPGEVKVWAAYGDVAINCAGLIPDKAPSNHVDRLVRANSIGPDNVARYFRRVIHVSTDCVFDGRRPSTYQYAPADASSPPEAYGQSKALGELVVAYPHAAVVRTSFIGFDHGLLNWLIRSQGREVEGWTRAFWSGSTVWSVARGLVGILHSGMEGIIHLATVEPISKFDAITMLNEALKLGLTIKPKSVPFINRGLEATWPLPSLEESLEELKERYAYL